MKTGLIQLLVIMAILLSCRKEPESDIVDIPDQDFLAALIDFGVDTDGDGIISKTEAEAVETLHLEIPFDDAKGIDAFINLEYLVCKAGKLDVSANTLLRVLDCSGGGLSCLDVSNNTSIEHLWCSNNELTSLDVSCNSHLITLDCSHNHLTHLDVMSNPDLSTLTCGYNQLTGLAVSKNSALNSLFCEGNQLTGFITTYNTELFHLYCDENKLTHLDVSGNTKLHDLRCGNNRLTGLYVSKNPLLQFFHCEGNQISNLDLSDNIYLLRIGIGQMSTLHEVCVWTIPFPPQGVTVDTSDSPNVYFTMDCTDGIK